MGCLNLSENNLLLEYMSFDLKDDVLAEYLDYMACYGQYNHQSVIPFTRDNGPSLNLGPFIVSRFSHNSQFILKVAYYYQMRMMEVMQIKRVQINKVDVLSFDFYGKGILVFNRECLWEEVEKLLGYFGVNNVVLTRLDYAVDCGKLNFKKQNKLNNKNHFDIINDQTGNLEYTLFGSKRTSPRFIRYYNKKIDLQVTDYEWLYPQYLDEKEVMRYELQVKSDGIAKEDKIQKVDQLKYIAHLGRYLERNKRSHHADEVLPEDLKTCINIIDKYGKTKNLRLLTRLSLVLSKYM